MSSAPSTAFASDARVCAALDGLRARGDHYVLLNAALSYLDNTPNDAAVILRACESFIALGLTGPARDLLARMPVDEGARDEVRTLRDQIARAASGRVSWGSLQARFEANLAKVYERHPDLRRHDAVFRSVPRRYELYRSLDGNLHVAERSTDGKRRWVPDMCDVKKAVADAVLPHDPKLLICGPYVIAGDRLGTLFHRVFQATEKMFLQFSPRIYLLESDVAALGVFLYVAESVDAFCHERVCVFAGEDCVDRLVAHIGAHSGLGIPAYFVRLSPVGETLCVRAIEVLRRLGEARERRAASTLAEMTAYYDSLPAPHWHTRLVQNPAEPLRVLGITSRFTTYLQYSMRDWGAAFEALGHRFTVLMEQSDHDPMPPIRIAEAVAEHKPDLIVCIDHFRPEYREVVPSNVPFVGWVQDALPHLYNRQCGESLGRWDYYIASDPEPLVGQYGYPASQGLASTMVTSEHQYDDARLSDEALAPYRCDVSYVSNQSGQPSTFHAERRQWFVRDSGAIRLADFLYEMLADAYARRKPEIYIEREHLLARAEKATGAYPGSPEARDALLNSYLYPLAELMLRQTTLEWVADYCDRTGRTLNLYGNGWELHPRFARYARGTAKNGAELRAIYQASAVNLQIIGTGAIHQRLLDGLAAGGFFLIRYSPSDVLHTLFQRYLDAVRRRPVELDRPYEPRELPEVAAALRDLWVFRGLEPQIDRIVVSSGRMRVFQRMEASGYRQFAGAVFPEYGDVSFDSPEAFERVAERFLGDAEARRRVAQSMRTVVVGRYSYAALTRELLALIDRCVAQEEPAGAVRGAQD